MIARWGTPARDNLRRLSIAKPSRSEHRRSWLLARGGRRRFSYLEDLRAYSLFHPRVADPEETDAIDAVGVRAGLEGAADLVDPKRIVEDLHSFRRVHVDGLVLSDRHLAAVVAHRGDATQQEEREVGRPGGNDEAVDLDFLPVVGLHRLGHFEVRPDRID